MKSAVTGPFTTIAAVLLGLSAFCLAGDEPLTVDPRAWQELDIIPMPKEICLSERDVSMSPDEVVVVLGEKRCRQSEIGAEWINQRLRAVGGCPLRIISERNPADAAVALVIGTLKGNSLIAQAAAAGAVNVGEDNPGERGYEIRTSKDGRRIYLAGADPIGALYACVTVGEMLTRRDGTVVWPSAEIRDWPDFRSTRMASFIASSNALDFPEVRVIASVPSPQQRERYLAEVRAFHDRLLRWKASSFQYELHWHFPWVRNASPEGTALVREGIEYGRERGIHAKMSCKPFVAIRADRPDLKTEIDLERNPYHAWIMGWAPQFDEPRRRRAEQLAEFARELGIDELYFHDTDTGGPYNPTLWNERSKASRQRWGDDYTAAVAHKHLIYQQAISRHVPGAAIAFTFYPYSASILDPQSGGSPERRQYYERFWSRLNEAMPESVLLCIREQYDGNLERLRQLWTKGIYFWYGGNKTWQTFYTEYPRHLVTFYRTPDDAIQAEPRGEVFVPLQSLGILEYAWNVHTPGAAPYFRPPDRYGRELWKQAEGDNPVFTVILPHVVRNLFGRRAAPAVIEAVRQNISFNQLFHPLQPVMAAEGGHLLATHDLLRQQADRAEAGAGILDDLWRQCQETPDRLGMDDYGFRRLVYLREVYHTCMWMAKIQAADALARDHARTQQEPEAQAAIKAGLEAVEAARVDLARLLEERPDDPVLNKLRAERPGHKQRVVLQYMANGIIDLDKMEASLRQTQRELPELGPLPDTVLDLLAERRMLRAVRAAGLITVDGTLDEPAWKAAYPIESFLALNGGKRVARAHTRARMCYDEQTLYVGVENWVPGSSGTSQDQSDLPVERDAVELFLKPRSLNGDYVHLTFDSEGRVRQQRLRYQGSDQRGWQRDTQWECPGLEFQTGTADARWILEVALPLASLGETRPGEALEVSLARDVALSTGQRDLSSTLPPAARSFHHVEGFRRIVWAADETYHPEVQWETPRFAVKTRTLDDGVAAVAEFGIDLSANQVLHDVEIAAETYGPDGALHEREVLARIPRVHYRWATPDTFSIAFNRPLDRGGVRLAVDCQEGCWEHWVRFGGWAGSSQIGSLFELPRPDGVARGGFLATPHLVGAAHLPSFVQLSDREPLVRVMAEKRGTVEFWFRPAWPGRFPPPQHSRSEYGWLDHLLVHFGEPHPRYPQSFWPSGFVIRHSGYYGTLSLDVANRRNASWRCGVSIKESSEWLPGKWVHVAAVWDADSAPEDWVRLYVNGARVSGAASVQKPERLADDKSVRVQIDPPFAIQLGGLNTGRRPAAGAFDELRISSVARYTADFEPPRNELQPDVDTTALFHFNGNLGGEGIAETGTHYAFLAKPGFQAHH